jgi:hypothetical protein
MAILYNEDEENLKEANMGDIKSAREIAMEKIEKIGEATEEERLEWKFLPEGEKLGAKYLKNDAELAPELAKCDKKALEYVKEGLTEVLIKNINLPSNEISKKNNKKAMDGLRSIKSDKGRVDAVYKQMNHIFEHYAGQGEQQRKQAYATLKQQFQAKVEQALKQQMGSTQGMKIDIEKQPQFQEEWLRLRSQLDGQYLQVLGELKEELAITP